MYMLLIIFIHISSDVQIYVYKFSIDKIFDYKPSNDEIYT